MVVRQGDVSVVHLTGEIDIDTAEPVERSVTGHTGDGPAMVVDLTEVTFIDSAGVRMLDNVVDACARGAVRVQIVAPPDSAVRFTLSICAFREDLLSDSVAEAIGRVGPGA
jgi:anti-sigma B factor antagonist